MRPELQTKLIRKAGNLLGRRLYSRGELRLKLEKWAEAEDVSPVLDRLEELELLNDADYAYNFTLRRIKEGWGPVKVHHRLIHRHVAEQVAKSAIDRVQSEVGDLFALPDYLARRFQKATMPGDRKAIEKLIVHLRRRGFYDETIWSTLHELIPPAAWDRFKEEE